MDLARPLYSKLNVQSGYLKALGEPIGVNPKAHSGDVTSEALKEEIERKNM